MSNGKKIIMVICILCIGLGLGYVGHTMYADKESSKQDNTVVESSSGFTGQAPSARSGPEMNNQGQTQSRSTGQTLSQASNLPPQNQLQPILVHMRNISFKLESGLSFRDFTADNQSLYGEIESFIADYGSNDEINAELRKVETSMEDLKGYWDLSIEYHAGYVFEDYNPNDKYWIYLRGRHPDIDNAKRNGNDLISIDDVRSVLMHDLKTQMINSSHIIVGKYQ